MWRLFYPLRYFMLDNKEKRRLDIWVSVVLGLSIAAPFLFLPGVSFFRPNGFLDKLLNLTAALTGFYVAALVAAATFNHPDLDNTIKSGPIALLSRDADGNRISELLTRREFVCTIFAYLAFSAFIISLVSAIGVALSGADFNVMSKWRYIGTLVDYIAWPYVRGVAIIVISVAVAHLVAATSLGIYYLMDRLYRHDRRITTKKKPGEAA